MKVWKMDEVQKKQTISAYMASVHFMDEQVGRLLNALDRLDLRDETIVIFISDHGYNLGEHDCWSKVSLWEGSVRVPLIISVPGAGKINGKTCESIVELIDLYPTLTELCGLSQEQPEVLQGKSLAGYLIDGKTKPGESLAYTISYGGKGATLRSDCWRYTRWGEDLDEGNEELYDHSGDPDEHLNLADDPKNREILEEMRKKFELAREKARTKL
jgi:arylsulfatase A-like enzyme